MRLAEKLKILPILLVLLAIGCEGDNLSFEGRNRLNASLNLYKQGKFDRTIKQTKQIISVEKQGFGTDQAIYIRGLSYAKKGMLSDAKRDFQEVATYTNSDSLSLKALDALGEMQYQLGEIPQAIDSFIKVIDYCPAEAVKPIDHARYRLAKCYQRQGKWSDANAQLYKLCYDFPNSKYAQKAKPQAGSSAWTIRMGSFRNRKNANKQSLELSKYFKTYCKTDLKDGKPIYYLQVGRYDNYKAALARLGAVKKIKRDAFIQVTR